LAEAEDYYQQAVSTLEGAFGSGAPQLVRTLNNLANVHREQRENDRAEQVQLRAVAIMYEHPDEIQPDHKEALISNYSADLAEGVPKIKA